MVESMVKRKTTVAAEAVKEEIGEAEEAEAVTENGVTVEAEVEKDQEAKEEAKEDAEVDVAVAEVKELNKKLIKLTESRTKFSMLFNTEYLQIQSTYTEFVQQRPVLFVIAES